MTALIILAVSSVALVIWYFLYLKHYNYDSLYGENLPKLPAETARLIESIGVDESPWMPAPLLTKYADEDSVCNDEHWYFFCLLVVEAENAD